MEVLDAGGGREDPLAAVLNEKFEREYEEGGGHLLEKTTSFKRYSLLTHPRRQ